MSNFFKDNWNYIFLSLFVLFLFSLRFINLTKLPVFADEAIYIRWSQVMKAEETLRFLPLSDGKQPLFMWATMFPLEVLSDPLLAGRIVSVLSGFGTLVGVGVLSYLLFKSMKTSLGASAIYAISPYAFFFDRMALADSMLAMFGLWTFIFSYLAVTKIRLDYAMIAGFALGGAWLTKSPALFFALLLPTLWTFTGEVKHLKKIIPLTLVTQIVGYGIYNILRLGPNFHQITTRNADYVYPLNHILTDPINPFKTFLLMSFEWIWVMGTGAIIAIWFYSYIVNAKKYWKELMILTIWVLGPILVQSEFAKVFTARYIFFTLPFLIVIASGVFKESFKKQVLPLIILVIFIVQSLVFNYRLLTDPSKAGLHRSERSGYLEEWTAGQGIREISQYLKNEAKNLPDGRQIVVGTEGYFGTLPDGLQMYFDKDPSVLVIGVGLELDKIPGSLADTKKSGNRVFLVANNERMNTDFEELGAKIINRYPKAARPNGSFQELWLLEL